MAKPFLTYDEQLGKLINEKDLVIRELEYAENKLKQIGYFTLIGGYKHPFKNKTTGKYKYDVTFEEIVMLYQFDEELKALFLKYILHEERKIKSLLSYHFCDRFGEAQDSYLDVNSYNYTRKSRYTDCYW